jgi:hypothetical protein
MAWCVRIYETSTSGGTRFAGYYLSDDSPPSVDCIPVYDHEADAEADAEAVNRTWGYAYAHAAPIEIVHVDTRISPAGGA